MISVRHLAISIWIHKHSQLMIRRIHSSNESYARDISFIWYLISQDFRVSLDHTDGVVHICLDQDFFRKRCSKIKSTFLKAFYANIKSVSRRNVLRADGHNVFTNNWTAPITFLIAQRLLVCFWNEHIRIRFVVFRRYSDQKIFLAVVASRDHKLENFIWFFWKRNDRFFPNC